MVQDSDAQAARNFWQRELDGIGVDAKLACSFPRTLLEYSPGDESLSITRPLAAESRVTWQVPMPNVKNRNDAAARLPIMLEAAWALTISTYVGSEDVLFGAVRSGRTANSCLVKVVGPTACIVPRRYRMHDLKDVRAFLEEASSKAAAATPHEHAGISLMQELLSGRGPAKLNNLLVVQTDTLVSESGEAGQEHIDGIGLKLAEARDSVGASYPFGVVLECILPRPSDHQEQIQLLAYYDKHELGEDTMQRVLSQFGHILTQLAINMTRPGALLKDIGIWSPELVRGQLPFTHTAPPPPAIETCVQELVAQHWKQGSAQANAQAVCMAQGLSLTYRDLERLSALLCRRLLRTDGFDTYQKSPFVAVCFRKSPWTVVAMLAIWRAGGAVVLLDANQPRNRLHTIARRAKPVLILVTREEKHLWQDHSGVLELDFATLDTPLADKDAIQPSAYPATSSDPCYCVFTSGSTGEAKGVVVQHRAIATSAVHHGRVTGLSTGSRVLQFSSYSFDVAMSEILTTLIHGGCVCVVSEEDSKARLAEAVCEMNVNVVLLTPGVLETLDPAAVPCLKTVVVGGSSLSLSLRKVWQDRIRLLIAYGPSECSVTAAMETGVGDAPFNTIGKPVGCRAWVLGPIYDDDNNNKRPTRPLRLAPLGSAGELVIEGPILAQGYLDDDELTAQKFISASSIAGGFCAATSCSPRARFYRSGDMVRQRSDGSLVFIGRHDNQVKVRGVRVELEAIEHLILQSDEITDSVRNMVAAMPQKGPLSGRLVGVLELPHMRTSSTAGPVDEVVVGHIPQTLMKVITAHLAKHLPDSHIPEVWASMESFPCLSSCKVNRTSIRQTLEAIPKDRCFPARINSRRPFELSMSKPAYEAMLRDLMGQVLGGLDLSSVPGSATFPRLGGNSLMAMQLVAKCKSAGLSLSLTHLLGNRSIAELAKAITEAKTNNQPQQAKGPQTWGRVQLTPAQRMFFSLYPFGPNYFNQSMFVGIDSPGLSTEDLQGHLFTLIEQHPALRMRFSRRRAKSVGVWKWKCVIANEVSDSLRFRTHFLQAGQDADQVARVTAETQQSLNINAGPLFAADIFIMPDGTMEMLLVSHHLVVDVVSWSVLLNDLEALLSGMVLSSETTYKPSQQPMRCQEEEPDDPPTRDEICEFWGLTDDRLAGSQIVHGPTKWTVSLGLSRTRALSELIATIEELDLADVVEAALGSAFAEFCWRQGRQVGPRLWVEEHGRGNDVGTTVGWFTKVRPASPSASAVSLVDSIWKARHRRLHSRDGRHTIMPSLPLELVLNYLGQPIVNKTTARLFELSSPRAKAAAEVPDTDPSLQAMALIEVVARLGDQGLSLAVCCDGRIQHVDRVHACIDSCVQLLSLQADAPDVLASCLVRKTLRPLPAIDTEDYKTSQRRRDQIQRALELETFDEVQEVMACTPAQTRIVLGQAREPRHYHVRAAWTVSAAEGCTAKIDVDKLQLACNQVVQHHASMRTEFVHLPDLAAPVQVVLRNPSPGKVLSVRPASDGGRAVQVELSITHAAFDGISTATVLRDIGLGYGGKPLDTNNATTLREYVSYVSQIDTQATEAFWARRLSDVRPCCLPTMGFAGHDQETHFGYFDCSLGGGLEAAMRNWCVRYSATPATAIHVAWALTLCAYTGLEDVCFGWMTTGRDAPVLGIDDAVGMFTSIVVCRANVAPDRHLSDVVAAMVQELADGLEHHLGSPQLYQHGQPLFDTLVSVQATPSAVKDEGLVFHQLRGLDRTEFALYLNVGVDDDTVELRVTYDALKISRTAALAYSAAFEQALEMMLTMPDEAETTLSNIDLCSPVHRQLAIDFNSSSVHAPQGALETQLAHTIPSLFSRHVERCPDDVAVESWDARFTFAELDHVSAGLSRHLSSLGLSRGQIVPLLCDKSAWAVVSMLAILRAGASCACLSPSDGIRRLKNIIVDQIGAQVIVVSPEYAEKTRALKCPHIVVLDPLSIPQQTVVRGASTQASVKVDDIHPEDVAFVVFTSGSTGKPKGVMLPHSSLCCSVLHYSRLFGISGRSRIFQFSAYTFDVGIGDVISGLINGATLCVPSEQNRTSDLNGEIERSKPTFLATTPSVAALLLLHKCQSLQSLMLIGECATAELYSTWYGRVNLFNAWGPAECAVLSSVHKVQSQHDDPSLIGEPSNCRLWLVSPSDRSRLVPSGCVGEILVEGPNVAYGYINDQERTQQVFISSDTAPRALQPCTPNARLYLTGEYE